MNLILELINFISGLRMVYPYYFNFTTYAKGRWIGHTILDIFTKEFRKDTPENYVIIYILLDTFKR